MTDETLEELLARFRDLSRRVSVSLDQALTEAASDSGDLRGTAAVLRLIPSLKRDVECWEMTISRLEREVHQRCT